MLPSASSQSLSLRSKHTCTLLRAFRGLFHFLGLSFSPSISSCRSVLVHAAVPLPYMPSCLPPCLQKTARSRPAPNPPPRQVRVKSEATAAARLSAFRFVCLPACGLSILVPFSPPICQHRQSFRYSRCTKCIISTLSFPSVRTTESPG